MTTTIRHRKQTAHQIPGGWVCVAPGWDTAYRPVWIVRTVHLNAPTVDHVRFPDRDTAEHVAQRIADSLNDQRPASHETLTGATR